MHGVQGWVNDARDTTVEPITTRNPLVTVDGVRCYAGIPLITSKGHAIGTFCVAGATPRDFSEEELDVLRRLAQSAMARIEARRRA